VKDTCDSGWSKAVANDHCIFGSKQLTFVQMFGMLHSVNHSVACAVLQMRPLAKAAEAYCTVLRPLAIEAPIADHEAPAFRPLIITAAVVHCALLRTLAVEAPIIPSLFLRPLHPGYSSLLMRSL